MSPSSITLLKRLKTSPKNVMYTDPIEVRDMADLKAHGLVNAAVQSPSKGLLNYGEMSEAFFRDVTPAGLAYPTD